MALWTDIIDPSTLTGYARASLADYEANKGTLARWLPNREVADVVVRFISGQSGLVDVARFRAFDAELEIGRRVPGKRVTLELPALGLNIPITEYEQLRARSGNITDEAALVTIQRATDIVVRATSDAIERLRGIVLATGIATIAQNNYASVDDFGRPASHTVTAPALWSVPATDRLGQLETWADVYRDTTGEDPGALLMSTRVFRGLASGTQMATQLLNSSSRPATQQQVEDTVSASGLPPIYRYDRRVSVNGVSTKALPDNMVYLLPAPVDPNDSLGTDLGATFWGRTLTSTVPDWQIADSEQPGIVTGVYRNEKPPMGLEVIGDAIALPVMANADRSFAATVLASA